MFFTTIAKKIEPNIVHTPRNYKDYLANPSKKILFLTPTSHNEVEEIVKASHLRKSIGPKVFSLNFLKNIPKRSIFQSPNYL